MDRVYSMLGIAAKAGKVKSGAFLTVQEILAGRARLVLLVKDAGSNTVKQIRDKCALIYQSEERGKNGENED